MIRAYRVAALAAWLLILLAAPAPATPTSKPHPRRPAGHHRNTGSHPPEAVGGDPTLRYSRRALRRARLIVELRWLQLREQRLTCIRAALERTLPADLLPFDASKVARTDVLRCAR